jgi:lipopolysaccharide transport system ATP-binding protein
VLEVQRLSKRFKIYNRTADRLLEGLFGKARHRVHVALDDISFSLGQGEAIGVLGQNGAGKSTLLKLVSGVLMPDAGTIERRGRIAGLLELGTGFDGSERKTDWHDQRGDRGTIRRDRCFFRAGRFH